MTRARSLPIPAAGARRRRPGRFGRSVLDWYDANGRALTFRSTSDPWAILVSEVMLQQTQVARVEPAWRAFLTRFPTPAVLASAAPAGVLQAWVGLGYNRRALALQRAAIIIIDRHGGAVPDDVAALERLPGPGPYTARAVAAIAYGRPVGAVDVNVRRVLARLAGIDGGSPDRATVQRLADSLVPSGRPADWTHALMDLGATICRPRAPRCPSCPVRTWCRSSESPAERGDTDGVGADLPRAATVARAPFESTSRWLRGRIVRDLSRIQIGAWTAINSPIGDHDETAVTRALAALEADGLVERRPDGRVRLPSGPAAAG